MIPFLIYCCFFLKKETSENLKDAGNELILQDENIVQF